jgi:cytolysin (calcineurin-like family phosphatase)
MQVVAGINHILHLETSDDSGKKEVEVTVYEKLPANVKANEAPMELTANKLVGPVAEVSSKHSGFSTVWLHQDVHARAGKQQPAYLLGENNSLMPTAPAWFNQ